MNAFRFAAVFFGVIGLLLGIMMSIREEPAFGRSLMIAGAIIISGFLISSAILQIKER